MLQALLNLGVGWFLGFFLGFGCSLAVIYQIYLGGYRKAIEDSLLDPPPANYTRLFSKARQASISTTSR